jgi:hypothetical protein
VLWRLSGDPLIISSELDIYRLSDYCKSIQELY